MEECPPHCIMALIEKLYQYQGTVVALDSARVLDSQGVVTQAAIGAMPAARRKRLFAKLCEVSDDTRRAGARRLGLAQELDVAEVALKKAPTDLASRHSAEERYRIARARLRGAIRKHDNKLHGQLRQARATAQAWRCYTRRMEELIKTGRAVEADDLPLPGQCDTQ